MDQDDEGIRVYQSRVERINARERQVREKSDEELRAVTDELRAYLQKDTLKVQEARERIPIPFRARHTENVSDDRDIALAIGDWEDVAEVATGWTEMSEEEQFLYFIDWPVAEQRTQRLLAMESALPDNDERAVKLRELRALVERNQPLLNRMRSGPMTSRD